MHTVGDHESAQCAPSRAADPEELLARIARGDESAFAALYDCATSSVYGLLIRILRDPAAAAEVAEDVWVQVWRSAPTFTTRHGRALTWILALARREGIERLRSAGPRGRTAPKPGPPEWSCDRGADKRGAGTPEQDRRLPANPAELTGLQDQAVAMAYYHGRTSREIGAELGASPREVTAAIGEGLRRLRAEQRGGDVRKKPAPHLR